jgi:hypothetical protein
LGGQPRKHTQDNQCGAPEIKWSTAMPYLVSITSPYCLSIL